MANPRQLARQRAVQALYSWQLTHGEPASIDTEFRIENDMDGVDLDYFRELLREIPANCDELDGYIAPLLPRPLNEVDPVERAILRMGAYELKYRPDVPYRVAINEGVELTKVFGAEQAHRFVNGILDGMARALRGVEQAADERPIPAPAVTADGTVAKGKYGQKRAPVIRQATKKRVIKRRNIAIPNADGSFPETETVAAKPAADVPHEKRTPLKKDAGKKPVSKSPVSKKPVSNKSPAKSLYGAKPAAQKSVVKSPVAERSVEKSPVTESPAAEKPAVKKTSASLYGGKKKTDS